MDSISEVKQALSTHARETSLEELRSHGRERVRVIRPEHIAQMIEEAVQNTVAKTGMVARDEVDDLVSQSQDEFKKLLRERESELEEARKARDEVKRLTDECSALNAQLEDGAGSSDEAKALQARVDQLTQERDSTFDNVKVLNEERSRISSELEVVAAERDRLAEELQQASSERAALIQKLTAAATPTAAPASAEGATDAAALASTLDKLAGSLDERLEKMGRKMGISSAVEAGDVNFDALFSRDAVQEVDSNMADVQVTKKQEGGIGAHLERLKKLKGGG